MPKLKITWLAVGLIMILGAIAYGNSFQNPFFWDDQNLIVENPYIKDIRLVKNLFTKDLAFGTQFSNFYRPLQSLSFELDYHLWGLNPFGFHLTNLLLHTGCALVVYFLFSLIFPASRAIPLISALLFLVHPIQTEAVTYISGRADSQASLFILLSIFFYLKTSLKTQPKNNLFLLASTVSFILALLSKETALILPLLILLFNLSFPQGSKRHYWPYFLVALVYILLRSTVLNFLQRPLFLSDANLYLRLLTSAKTFALYLGLFFLPFNLHMERSLPYVSSILDKDVLFSLILLMLLIILILRSYKSSKLCFFAGIWFFLTLLPVSNIVPLNANMAEHWLYLPSIGFFLLVAFGFDKLLKKANSIKRLSVILIIILISFYCFLTVKRNQEWGDPETFFRKILVYNPQSTEAYNCLGAIYQNQNKLDLAIDAFRRAVQIDTFNYKSYGNLGSALRKKKEYDLAISAYKKALALRPDIPGLYNNLGNVYADRGQLQQAKEMLEQALRLYPEFPLGRANLAKIYSEMGDSDSAIKEYKKAIALQPNLVLAHYNLGIAYQKQGEYDLAIDEYKKTINISPRHIAAHLNLGTAYNVKGYLNEAIEQYQKVLEIDPYFFHAYHNLGVAYFKKKEFSRPKRIFCRP